MKVRNFVYVLSIISFLTFTICCKYGDNLFIKRKLDSPKCSTNCYLPFGTELGSNSNVTAYSNCNEYCVSSNDITLQKEVTGYLRDSYSGMKWQCVEYARRWLIITAKVTFVSVDYAYQIFNLTTVEDLTKSSGTFPFDSYTNENPIPPAKGDLLIFPNGTNDITGHVAAVLDVNLDEEYVEIGEQNWIKVWEKSNYSRRLKLVKIKRDYILTTLNVKESHQVIDVTNEKSKVIGWKRVRI